LLICNITQICLVVSYSPFSTGYCFYHRRPMTHEAETISCPETSRNNYRSTQGKIPEERTTQLERTSFEKGTFMLI